MLPEQLFGNVIWFVRCRNFFVLNFHPCRTVFFRVMLLFFLFGSGFDWVVQFYRIIFVPTWEGLRYWVGCCTYSSSKVVFWGLLFRLLDYIFLIYFCLKGFILVIWLESCDLSAFWSLGFSCLVEDVRVFCEGCRLKVVKIWRLGTCRGFYRHWEAFWGRFGWF